MYQTYRNEANARGWRLWPYYLHVAFLVETAVLGFVVLAVIFVRT